MTNKKILDVTCGGKSIWFNKNHPLAVYCDIREGDFDVNYGENYEKVQRISVHPDVIADFTDLPFPDESFNLVVFDPPHLTNLSAKSWLSKKYGCLENDWQRIIRGGADECFRVLVPYGVMVFKWADTQISTREVIEVIGREPLFGHRSGKKMGTHFMTFMKIPDDEDKI